MSGGVSDRSFGANRGAVVLASAVRSTVDLAVALGSDRAALLARIGLTEADLADPDGAVPVDAHTAAWEVLDEHPAAETLSIELAQQLRLDSLGVFGWVMANAATGREVIECIRRYRNLFGGDPYTPDIEEVAGAVVMHRVFEPRIARQRVSAEIAPASTVAFLRQLLALDPSVPLVREVWYQHGAPRDPSVHEAFFGCTPLFSAPETRLVLAGDVLERPVAKRDASLHAYLERHARSLSVLFAERGSIGERVRALVAETLKSGEPSQADVARKLGMSERTLQRRLKEEERTFADVLDTIRRELAVRYLADPDLAVYEVALLLGYAESSSFHRAIRRWTGESPTELRARLRAGARGALPRR